MNVKKIQVYDPPMCCSTGVCGPSVDPELVRFAADLNWLKNNGIIVERFNLSQQPEEFVKSAIVKTQLLNDENSLPLILVDNVIKFKGKYPSKEELAHATEIIFSEQKSIYNEQVDELVAISAAIASNCDKCFRFHYKKALELGISKEDMLMAVETANKVKNAPSKAILSLAHKTLVNFSNGSISNGEEEEEDTPKRCC